MLPLLLAALVGTPLACAPKHAASEDEVVQVDALLSGRRATLLRTRATREVRPLAPGAPEGQPGIRWELVATGGKVVARGRGPDARAARYEFGDQSQVDGVADLRGPIGTVSIEVPNVEGTLHFWDADGTPVGQADFHAIVPAGDGVSESSLVNLSTDVLGTPVALVDHGSPDTHVNFLLLPEGYTEEELPAFHDVAANVATKLQQIPGYTEHWDSINVYYQDVRSATSGIADPSAPNVAKDTAFDVTFGDGVTSPRHCALPSHKVAASVIASMQAIARSVSADQVVIIANTREFAGCAMPSDHLAVMSASDDALRVMAHEVGHALFKLADEYTDNPPACDLAQWKGGAPNVSSELDALPWQDLILPGTALPTPADGDSGAVGAVEGAGYCAQGAYRPTKTCIMHALEENFCPVCMREVDRFFTGRARGNKVTDVRVKNATGDGLFVGCSGTPSPSCSGLTFVAAGASATIQTVDGSMVVDTTTIPTAPIHWSFAHVAATGSEVTVHANARRPLE